LTLNVKYPGHVLQMCLQSLFHTSYACLTSSYYIRNERGKGYSLVAVDIISRGLTFSRYCRRRGRRASRPGTMVDSCV